MPIIIGNIVAVSKDELIPQYYSSYEALKKALQRYQGKPYGIKRVMIGGNGRQMLINFDTLSGDIKDAIGDPRKVSHIMQRFYKTDPEAVRYFTTYKFDDGTYLSQDHQEKYITNASVLTSAIALRTARLQEWKSKGRSKVGINQTVCADVQSFNEVLLKKHRVEHNLPSSLTHFNRVMKEYEQVTDGKPNYESLISKKHRNSNSRKVDEATLKLLNDLFADKQTKPNASMVHRTYEAFLSGYIVDVVNNKTGEVYDPADFKPLSVETVNRYLTNWTSAIATHGVRSANRQVYMGKYVPYHSFEKTQYAGSIISVDDRQPPFKTLDGKRIWFYNGIDLGSEAFTTWVYGETKEGIILEFYRQMLRNYHEWGVHLPAEIEAEMSLNSSFQETFLKPGVMFDYVHIEANRARVKRIERYFGNLRYNYEKERKGWLARPNAIRESNQAGVEIEKVPKVPYEDIVDGCLADIERWNNQPHSVHKDKTRWQVFMEMQNPNIKPTNYLAILPYIGYTTKTSVRTGIVKLQGREYLLGMNGNVAIGQNLIKLMQRIEGRDILVYWLDDNNGDVMKAYAYENETLVCELIAKPTYKRARVERGESDELANATMSAYVATVNSYAKEIRKSIDGVTVIKKEVAKTTGGFSIRRNKAKMNYDEHRTIEIMPAIEEEEFLAEVASYKSNLRDRF